MSGFDPLASPPRRRFLARLCAIAAGGLGNLAEAASPVDAAPALQLAGEAPDGMDPRGWLVSEKLDGVRAFWDGRTLRFRSGRPIPAPHDWLARLPAVPLDGELWLGRGRFDEVSGRLRRSVPSREDWADLQYQLFDLPGAEGSFAQRHQRLRQLVARTGLATLEVLPQDTLSDADALRRRLREVVEAGGEGLMLHHADAPWRAGRSTQLLKLKPVHDAEAVVLAHVAGRGRLAGRLGALQVRNDAGVTFLLGSGLSDAERDVPPPVGSRVTYTYRGLTPGGVPRFASFLRRREEA